MYFVLIAKYFAVYNESSATPMKCALQTIDISRRDAKYSFTLALLISQMRTGSCWILHSRAKKGGFSRSIGESKILSRDGREILRVSLPTGRH